MLCRQGAVRKVFDVLKIQRRFFGNKKIHIEEGGRQSERLDDESLRKKILSKSSHKKREKLYRTLYQDRRAIANEQVAFRKELMAVYSKDPNESELERDLTIISKVTLGEMTFILTRDLNQYVQVGEKIYDMNTRFLEFPRRIYDYIGLKSYLAPDEAAELELFKKLMVFKYRKLFQKWEDKPTHYIKFTTFNHLLMDKELHIDDPVVSATRKYIEETPNALKQFLRPSGRNKNKEDFTELPNSKAVKKTMKGMPLLVGGVRKYTLKDCKELLEYESSSEREPEEEPEIY